MACYQVGVARRVFGEILFHHPLLAFTASSCFPSANREERGGRDGGRERDKQWESETSREGEIEMGG